MRLLQRLPHPIQSILRRCLAWDWIQIGLFALGICLALALRICLFDWKSGDYGNFLKHWYEYFQTHDGFTAFRDNFYDYTPAYLYILYIGALLRLPDLAFIKSVSIFFDVVLAMGVFQIVRLRSQKLASLAFFVTLFLPTVWMNSAMWGQCDGIYASFVVWSLYFLLKRNWLSAFSSFSLGFVFKAQALFFGPLFLILTVAGYLKKRWLLLLPLMMATVYCAMILPAAIAGRPIWNASDWKEGLLTIYYGQSGTYSSLCMNCGNAWRWVENRHFETLSPLGMILALAGVFFLLYLVSLYKPKANLNWIIQSAFLSVLLVPYILPKMHERYFYIAEILSIVFAFWNPKYFWVAVLIQMSSMILYGSYLIQNDRTISPLLEPNTVPILMFLAIAGAGVCWFLEMRTIATHHRKDTTSQALF